jgi:UDP:flavonoid glycosyltransferase YjiC (YdhE family)
MPLAEALKDAGHDVAFAVPAPLGPVIEGASFTFFPAGGDREKDPEFQHLMAQLRTMPPGPESERVIFGKVFTGVNPRLMVPDLVEIARAWKPDMLIREGAEFGAVIAAEVLGLPYADVCPGAYLKGIGAFEQGAHTNLDPIRESWGLPPDPSLEALHRYLMIAYSPPTFVDANIGVPGSYPLTTRFFHAQLFDGAGRKGLPDWVSSLPEQPTVYVTLGTEANNMPGIYPGVLRTIIEGLRDERVNLIVTLGLDKDPADFGSQPPNVRVERYIPQSLLLPLCDLIVMHGGSNSLLQALDLGLPMVVIPLIADQFVNGAVVQALGLGQTVQLSELSAETIRRAAREVLSNSDYRRNVRRLGDEMHALPDISQAVELVEQTIVEHEQALALRS